MGYKANDNEFYSHAASIMPIGWHCFGAFCSILVHFCIVLVHVLAMLAACDMLLYVLPCC